MILALVAPDARASEDERALAYPGTSNGKIAYIRNDAPSGGDTGKPCLGDDIWVMNANGSGQENINDTTIPFAMGDPTWSPDGKKIAYTYATQADVEDTGNEDTLIVALYNAQTGTHMGGVAALTLPDHPSLDAAAFCQQPYGPTWSPDGNKLAIQNYFGIAIIDLANGNRITRIDPTETFTYGNLAWAPFGGQFAVDGVSTMPTNSAPATKVTWSDVNGHPPNMTFEDNDLNFLTKPDWSPDGRTLLVRTGSPGLTQGSAVMRIGFLDTCGGATLRAIDPNPRGVPHFNYQPAWAPNGAQIVFSDRSFVPDPSAVGGNREEQDIWVMNTNGTGLENLTNTPKVGASEPWESAPDWQPVNPLPKPDPPSCIDETKRFDVRLRALGADGNPIEGIVAIAQTLEVHLTIENTTDDTLANFEFARGAPLVVDERSTGGIQIVSGPDPPIDPDLTLSPDETVTYTFEVTATADGIAAAHTKVTADAAGVPYEDAHSLLFDITDGLRLTKDLARFFMLQVMDRFLENAFGEWHAGWEARGMALAEKLAAGFTPEERELWFGSATDIPLSPFDFGMATLQATAPHMIAATFPKREWKGYTPEELELEYRKTFVKELGKGVRKWVKGWDGLRQGVQNKLAAAYVASALNTKALLGFGTPEERLQFEANLISLADGIDSVGPGILKLVTTQIPRAVGKVLVPTWLPGFLEDALLQTPDLQAQIKADSIWSANVAKRAKTNPLGYQRDIAERDAEVANFLLPLMLDDVAGTFVFKGLGKLKGVIVKEGGAAVFRSGVASGALTKGGTVAEGAQDAIALSESTAGHGLTNSATAELASKGSFYDNLEGATIVQSTDAGRVYELPNLGGVPHITLDVKAGILGELETMWAAAPGGGQIKLAEVLKTSSALRKELGVAKTELTAQKTIKPEALRAGVPRDLLAESAVWTSPTNPNRLPGFKNLSPIEQEKVVKEWQKANTAWDEFHNPTDPASKTIRLKQCIGQRCSVPLEVNADGTAKTYVGGIQRWVEAEYALETFTQGDATGLAIRTKYYRTFEIDTSDGNRVLNSKVVHDYPRAVPQTADADAHALGKVVGVADDGKPILAPLEGSERRLIQWYIDANIKARRKPGGSKGSLAGAAANAEHGPTLPMIDAGAAAAGKLLPAYGAVILPQSLGLGFLERIAPFTAKHLIPKGASVEEAAAVVKAHYDQMVQLVHSNGGFGQKAIVVTSDSRYLGEVEFARW